MAKKKAETKKETTEVKEVKEPKKVVKKELTLKANGKCDIEFIKAIGSHTKKGKVVEATKEMAELLIKQGKAKAV